MSMHSRLIRRLGALILAAGGLLAATRPASAIMGQELKTVRGYFCKGQKKPPCGPVTLLASMQNFAQMRLEAQPTQLSYYVDSKGVIQRQHWLAPPENMWHMSVATKIRDAIMGGQSSNGVMSTGMENLVYHYPDGTRVFFLVRNNKVYSILAIAKGFDPGEQSKHPTHPGYFDPDTTIFIKPKS